MTTTEITRFLDAGLTSAHVAVEISSRLREAGSRELEPTGHWTIGKGELVHIVLDGTVLAFRGGHADVDDAGLVIGAAHTDSPGLQLKDRSAVVVDGFLQVPVEVYGGPVLATWTDRDFLVVGKIAVQGRNQPIEVRLFSSRRPLGLIPNLAIHLNREVNDSLSYNRQDHLKVLIPMMGGDATGNVGQVREGGGTGTPSSGPDVFKALIGKLAGIEAEDILDLELRLAPSEGATSIGTQDALIASARIDNLAGCISVMDGIIRADDGAGHSQMAVFFDHEEIGSTTAYGAAGDITRHMMERFLRARYGGGTDLDPIIGRTVLISNDGAHGRHPNYADKHDPGYAPLLGGGPVIKKSAVRRYASELLISAWFAEVCRELNVPVQYLQNRSDIPAGSTIGPAVASRLAIPSVDVGIPMLAMHSVREVAATGDIIAMAGVFRELFTRGGPRWGQ